MTFFNDMDLWSSFLTKDHFEIAPVEQFPANLNFCTLDISLGNEVESVDTNWMEKPVYQWQNKDVIQWIVSTLKDKIQIDQSNLNNFLQSSVFLYLNGNTLLTLTEMDFLYLDENVGHILYQSLQEYLNIFNNNYNHSNVCCDFQNNFQNLLPLDNQKSNYEDNYFQGPFDEMTNFCQENQLFYSNLPNLTTIPMISLSSSDSSDNRIEYPNSRLEKKLPGRPRNLHKITKKKSEKRTGRLWEFIRNLLLNRKYCPSLICWENYDEGVFRFVQSEKVAQLWGNLKSNPKMTYEKLSRAMRYYYKSKVLQPVLGRRLVYKFGPTAHGWRTSNPNFVN